MDLWEWAQSVILEATLMSPVSTHDGKVIKQPKKEGILVNSLQPVSVISYSNAGTMGSQMNALVVGAGWV